MTVETSETSGRSEVLTIGRARSNSIVLDHTNVSSHHARITITDGSMTLEDLGSTNGTSVGTVENKISRRQIQKTDTIFFGSSAYLVSDLLSQARVAPQGSSVGSSSNRSSTGSKKLAAGAAAVVVVLLVVGALAVMRSSGANRDDFAIGQSGEADSESVTAGTASNPDPSNVSSEQRIERSLFVLVVTDPQTKLAFRIGSCFAIDDRHLATTASVVTAMRELQSDGYTDAFLFSPATMSKLAVSAASVHPRYEQARKDARSAQQTYEEIIRRCEVDPPRPEEIEEVEKKLVVAKIRAFEAMEEQAVYDAAVLTAASPLDQWLPGEKRTPQFRPNVKLLVRGLAFDVEDPYFDQQESLEVASLESRFQRMAGIEPGRPTRLIATVDSEHIKSAFVGSPIFTANGNVVGLYARPTPPDAKEAGEEFGNRFDGPLFDRIIECLEHP